MQRQLFEPGEWDLADALPALEGPGLERIFEGLESKVKKFESSRTRLNTFSNDEMRAALDMYERIFEDLNRVSETAYMRYSVKTGDGEAKAGLDRAEDLRASVENRVLFFRLWWTSLDESAAARLRQDNPDHRYFLSTWRKLRPHTLDEKVEQAVTLKNTTGFAGWAHHYDKFVSDFSFVLPSRKGAKGPAPGREKKLVVDQVTRLFASPDPFLREAAYKALLGKYAENGELLGEIYRTIVRDWRNENVQLRHYAKPISPRNLENDVGDGAVETLLDSCRRNARVFQGFFRVKAKLLGRGPMTRYHIYAPLLHKERTVGYADAVRRVLDAFRTFDPKVADYAMNVFRRNHVDATPRRGKTNGAYCMSVTPKVVPYLFLNFAGMSRDVYTIAHESGHAIHSQLASGHSVLTFHPPLVLAETASVFGEMILFDKLMGEEKDPAVKRAVLLEKISSMYATIGRQANFVLFENAAHDAVSRGETVNDLCVRYLANLRGQFGDAVKVTDDFQWEWTYIPHIYHTPFYCYAYAFGNLLSLSLYDLYKKEGRAFVPRYLRMLSYGGSESPGRVLSEIGVDMESPAFWQSGFNVIDRMVSDLRRL
ncbi:MAG: M3 family oligoendopeptidase [Thaumarchaeota archaeon]|nr:M3 family oligoendopeptidase [Nitrososphaerota archaeon]